MIHFFEDRSGRSSPDERLGGFIVLLDEAVDGGLQVNERMEDAALEALLCED